MSKLMAHVDVLRRFALNNPGWHSFQRDSFTLKVIARAIAGGYIQVDWIKTQFKGVK